MLTKLRIWWYWSHFALRMRRVLWCRWFGHDLDRYPAYSMGGGPPEPVWYCKRCDLDEGEEAKP